MRLYQIAQTQFRRRLISAVALPLLLTLVLSGVLLGQIRYLLSVTRWVDHTDQVIAEANRTQKLLLEMESGVRGYLLTGNPAFLEPYQRSRGLIEPALDDLSRLVKDNPSQVQHLQEFRATYQQWNPYNPTAIALKQRGGPLVPILNARKQRMDQMRNQMSLFIQTEETLRETRTQAAAQTTQTVMMTSMGLSLGLGSILALFIGRQLIEVSKSYGRALTIAQEQTEALRQSEERFRATFEQAAVGIAHVSLDGQWLIVNQRLCDIVGYNREELLQRTFQEITHPDDLNTDLEYVRQILADQIQMYSMEKRYIRKDGSLIWTNLTVSLVRDSFGEPQYFISAIQDISDRKQAAEQVWRSAQRLAALQEIDRAILAAQSLAELTQAALTRLSQVVPYQRAFVILFDFEQNTAKVLAVENPGSENAGLLESSLEKNVQYPIEEFIASEVLREESIRYCENIGILNQCPPFLEQQLAAGMQSCITVPLVAEENLFGELSLAANQPAAFNDEHREIIREVGNQLAIAIQQTQLREQLQRYAAELEQRVQERTAQLQEANAELEAFGYSVSHDLRAPLRAMEGFAEALSEDYADQLDELGQEYARRIIGATQSMNTLIQDLLEYSRLSRTELRLQPVDLTSVVAEALDQIKANLQAQQAQVTVDPLLPQVIGHRSTLVQVVTNLLSNAIKFVAPGVQPHVRVWATTLTKEEQTLSSHDLIWVRLWVEDNGIGIKPEHQERIFRVFERLHGIEAYPGTGIGLAIVRKGLERMGGRVGLESQLGQGSCFWIELPGKS